MTKKSFQLDKYGWQEYLSAINPVLGKLPIGRVSVENKTNYALLTEQGEQIGILRGNLIKSEQFPKVGDWVEYKQIEGDDKVVIENILPRKTLIARKDGETGLEQEIAANVDILFIVQSLDKDFSLPRLERYLTLARESKVKPIVLINKTDLKQDYFEDLAQVKAIAFEVPVYAVSAKNKTGLEEIRSYIKPGLTIAFMGSSGVGKSSLINAIVGVDIQQTGEVRIKDSRGRHTTTKREMIILPEGGILIDTPGIRELGMGSDAGAMADIFEDLEDLSLSCKYSNCDHEKSQGCAILEALEKGDLLQERYQRFLKLKREMDYLESKTSKKKEQERKTKEKNQHKKLKKILKHKRG